LLALYHLANGPQWATQGLSLAVNYYWQQLAKLP
jgi:hypothetical protein